MNKTFRLHTELSEQQNRSIGRVSAQLKFNLKRKHPQRVSTAHLPEDVLFILIIEEELDYFMSVFLQRSSGTVIITISTARLTCSPCN